MQRFDEQKTILSAAKQEIRNILEARQKENILQTLVRIKKAIEYGESQLFPPLSEFPHHNTDNFFVFCCNSIMDAIHPYQPFLESLANLEKAIAELHHDKTLLEETKIPLLFEPGLFFSDVNLKRPADIEKALRELHTLDDTIKEVIPFLDSMYGQTRNSTNANKPPLLSYFSLLILKSPVLLPFIKKIRKQVTEKIIELNNIQEINKSFDQFDDDVKAISSFIKHPGDKDYLNYIVENIPLQKISAIFGILSERKNTQAKNIYSKAELEAAQKAIYTAFDHSIKLKLQHVGRIAVAVLAFFILTPVSLFFTRRWIARHKHATLLEKRKVNLSTHANIRQLRKKYFDKPLLPSLFNAEGKLKSPKIIFDEQINFFNNQPQPSLFTAQGELKSVKITSENQTAILMTQAQAERFDRWKKMQAKVDYLTLIKHTHLVKDPQHTVFFTQSRAASKTVIDNCKANVYRR